MAPVSKVNPLFCWPEAPSSCSNFWISAAPVLGFMPMHYSLGSPTHNPPHQHWWAAIISLPRIHILAGSSWKASSHLPSSSQNKKKFFFVCLFVFFCCTTWHAGSYFLDLGLNLCPLHWKHGVLTTAPQASPFPRSFCLLVCFFRGDFLTLPQTSPAITEDSDVVATLQNIVSPSLSSSLSSRILPQISVDRQLPTESVSLPWLFFLLFLGFCPARTCCHSLRFPELVSSALPPVPLLLLSIRPG